MSECNDYLCYADAWITGHLCNVISLKCAVGWYIHVCSGRWVILFIFIFPLDGSIAWVACGNCSIWFDDSMIHAVMIFMSCDRDRHAHSRRAIQYSGKKKKKRGKTTNNISFDPFGIGYVSVRACDSTPIVQRTVVPFLSKWNRISISSTVNLLSEWTSTAHTSTHARARARAHKPKRDFVFPC